MIWTLIDDTTLTYVGANGFAAARHARVWEHPDTAERRCVVTERPEDAGPSVTNAAAAVTAAAKVWWGPDCTVIEHYPEYGPRDPEHFDAVEVDSHHQVHWRRLDTAALNAELPGLLSDHEGPAHD